MKIILVSLVVAALLFAAVVGFGILRWKTVTLALRARLGAMRVPITPACVDFQELENLPTPVQRYFRKVLKPGQPMIASVSLHQAGTINMGELADNWKPFTSDQVVVTKRPGFDWNGQIAMMPGLAVHVHDAYADGEGMLHAAMLGLFTVAKVRGIKDIAQGELMRFLAEAAWYPTALLPSQGVQWEAVDDRSADATLVDGDNRVDMRFTFSEQGLIDTINVKSRGRMVGKKSVPTPWLGRFWHYEERDGMLVPLEGEVSWVLSTGVKTYWRGSVSRIAYDFSEPVPSSPMARRDALPVRQQMLDAR